MRHGGYPARRGLRAPGRNDQLEGEIQRDIRLAAGRAVPDCVLWRNGTGVARHTDERTGDDRVVRYGLVKGGADLVGVLTVQGVGVFLAVEVKTPTGRLSPDQKLFGELVQRCGGVFIVARSVDDFVAQATAARARLEAPA